MEAKEMYVIYKNADNKDKKRVIRDIATENELTIQEVAERIMPYIRAEKPVNYFGKSVLIVGGLEDKKPYKDASRRLKGIKTHSLYDFKGYKDEDILAIIQHVNFDTVYYLDGWYEHKLCHKIKTLANDKRAIQCYEEYEVR